MRDRLEKRPLAPTDHDDVAVVRSAKLTWRPPEITTFVPASHTEGVFGFQPGDGISNLC